MEAVRHVAVLGSSFAAGPGIDPIVVRAAGRSARNYGHLVAERLNARLTDLSVSGATTDTILHTSQRMLLTRFPPQLEGLPDDADLVMITAGGNDLGYIGGLMRLAGIGSLRSGRLTGPIARRLPDPKLPEVTNEDQQRATDGLARVVTAVRDRAPQARVLLVDYPLLIGSDTVLGPDLPLQPAERRVMISIADRLAAAFATAAERTSAELVPVSAAGAGHAIGSPEPWVNGWLTRRGDGSRFHPNAAGMRAIAELVCRQVAGEPVE